MSELSPKYLFDWPLSPVEEYWVGYFRADGCISRSTKHKNAQFTQNEIHPVVEFAKFIGKEDKVRICNRSTNFGDTTYYSISSSKIAYSLDRLGAKTKLLQPIYESKHFWRGMLDGDGSVKLDIDRGILDWNGSLIDLQQLQNFIANTLDDGEPKIFKHSSIYRITITSNKAKYLAHLLYEGEYSANLKKLERIHQIFNFKYKTGASSWLPK